MEQKDHREKNVLELAPGVRQEQVLAPQLRECLRVLQMDWLALSKEVRHEAEINPVVELEGGGDMPMVSDEQREAVRSDENESDYAAEDESNPSVNIDEEAADRRQRFFDRQVATESLQEHLLAQIALAGFAEDERELAELIIGDIDDDGRYVGSFGELKSVTGADESKLSMVLTRVQTFDPPGVGGRNLRECLLIQARQLECDAVTKALVCRIVDAHLRTVAQRDIGKLADKLEASETECREALKWLITLEPKPGRQFIPHGKQPQFIKPEIEVEQTADGISIVSCEHDLPTLTISSTYREMAENEATPDETRTYLKKHIGSAELLQDAIRRRGETVLQVAEAVFDAQYDFFKRGFEAIKPLTIEEVAKMTGYHGTTVGRAVRGKYVRTPRGVFELNRFFCVGRLRKQGEKAISATAVKCRIASIIRAEKDETLTDDEISRRLTKEGVSISRRTVTKYRIGLGIPTASERERRRMK